MTRKALHFTRHYVEMVLAMFAGMGVFALVLAALGIDLDNEPLLVGMGLSMTVPMVAWMRYRGHGWAPTWEMSAAMLVPTAAAVVLLSAGALADSHAALMIQHVAMFPAMLVAMLARLGEYTHRHA